MGEYTNENVTKDEKDDKFEMNLYQITKINLVAVWNSIEIQKLHGCQKQYFTVYKAKRASSLQSPENSDEWKVVSMQT